MAIAGENPVALGHQCATKRGNLREETNAADAALAIIFLRLRFDSARGHPARNFMLICLIRADHIASFGQMPPGCA